MTRYLFGFVCLCALGVVPLVGCGDNNGGGGSGGTAGTGGTGGTGGSGVACQGNVCPCTEAGIRAAIAEGGGPFTFDCVGPQTVVIEADILIDNDVSLDGESNLTVDGNTEHSVFVLDDVKAGLEGFAVVGGSAGGIVSRGTLTLMNSTVSGNIGHGIEGSTVMLMNSTVSGNTGLGVLGFTVMLTNSTVSGNAAGGLAALGDSVLTSSTVLGSILAGREGLHATLTNSLVDGECEGYITSNSYNIESPGDTCGFDQATDQVNVSAEALALGPLQDNGGPTMTHALLPGSVAIEKIPEADCVDADGQPLTTDQRGVTRPQGDSCDVGAFELEVAP